jgi:hypothetical protein
MGAPIIHWGPHADRTKVSQYSLDVLAELLIRAGIEEATITSTVRSPADDARVVFDNLERPGGVAAARGLYKAPMQQVINVYVDAKRAGASSDEIKARMTATIIALGGRNCSHHILTDEELKEINVLDVDVAPEKKKAFRDVCAAESPAPQGTNPNGLLAKILVPPQDPCDHIEIRQQPTGAV